MPFTTAYANNLLNLAMAKKTEMNAPDTVFLGLCTNDPEASGGSVTELSGGAYTRIAISAKNSAYPDFMGNANGRAIQNNKQINWTKASVTWARVKGFFLSTSPTVGETSGIFFYGKLDLTEEEEAAGGLLVEAGMVALFDPAAFRISFSTVDG
jgi:hypothetical protein